jgi:hypothetical protein
MIFSMMANAAADPMISGNWIIAVIGAIAAGVAAVLGKMQGRKEGMNSRDVTLQAPVPEVPVKKVYSPPTFSQHMEIVRRVDALEADQKILRREMAESFLKLMQVGEERKDKIMEKIDDVAKGFHSRVDQIVKGPTRR